MRGTIELVLVCLLAACAGPGEQPTDQPIIVDDFDGQAALERGSAIAQATFAALSGEVKRAMARGGAEHAMDYCRTAALPITDSLATHHGVRIKRTSDRIRSPHNKPDDHEQGRLDAALALLATGVRPTELPAEVFIVGDSVAYYSPIVISSPMCLHCHGRPDLDLSVDMFGVIIDRYPLDDATNYALSDFRGLWSIRWKR